MHKLHFSVELNAYLVKLFSTFIMPRGEFGRLSNSITYVR